MTIYAQQATTSKQAYEREREEMNIDCQFPMVCHEHDAPQDGAKFARSNSLEQDVLPNKEDKHRKGILTMPQKPLTFVLGA